MGRINIKESLYSDERFLDLVRCVESYEFAIGVMVRAWCIAEKHYLFTENDRLIPRVEWNKFKHSSKLIEFGLAEEREKGIYVCGSQEQFKGLLQRSEAGKKSGLKRKQKRNGSATAVQRPFNDRATSFCTDNKQKTARQEDQKKDMSYILNFSKEKLIKNNNNNNSTDSVNSVARGVSYSDYSSSQKNSNLVILKNEKKEPIFNAVSDCLAALPQIVLERWQYEYPNEKARLKTLSRAFEWMTTCETPPTNIKQVQRVMAKFLLDTYETELTKSVYIEKTNSPSSKIDPSDERFKLVLKMLEEEKEAERKEMVIK